LKGAAALRNPYYEGPPSDHFDGLRFFNPPGPARDKGLADVLRWQLSGNKAQCATTVPVTPVRPEQRVDGTRVTMVGLASLLIQMHGLNILTDPVWAERASPLSFAGPKRVTEPGIRFADLPRIDAVLLSHNHYDHCDLGTLKRLVAEHDPLIVTPLGNDRLVRKAAVKARVFAGDWATRWRLPAAPLSPSSLLTTGRRAPRGIEGWRCGAASCCEVVGGRSTSLVTPALAKGGSLPTCARPSVPSTSH
jgi:glyoxylase-like metal-dependent hydrolase (beta-lactamase superfamily II)